jgi:hypothetical protein
MKKYLTPYRRDRPPNRGKEARMDLRAVRIWKGSNAVESVHVLDRADGRKEVVIVLAGGVEGIAEWILKAAELHDAERRRMEDPDGD